MTRIIFFFVFFFLIFLNIFLFRENGKLKKQLSNFGVENKIREEKIFRASSYLESLSLFFDGMTGESDPDILEKFDKAIRKIGDSEILARYQEIRNFESADKLLEFANFVSKKSLEEIRK